MAEPSKLEQLAVALDALAAARKPALEIWEKDSWQYASIQGELYAFTDAARMARDLDSKEKGDADQNR